jgi:hypothetical protein
MINARPFSISTLQDLSNDTKNTSMRGVLGLSVELQTFGSPGGVQIPNFGSGSFIVPLRPKWGCDNIYTSMGAKCVILVIKNNLCISGYTYVMTLLVYMEKSIKIYNFGL